MQKVIEEFSLSIEQLLLEAQKVTRQIEMGINGEVSDFAMLPSYLGFLLGQGEGCFLALDFGGSNLRIAKMQLGKNKISQQAVAQISLQELLPNKNGKMTELFFNIALFISDFAGEKGGLLGHAFSYPMVQNGINDGRLKNWTKELSFVDAKNVDINKILTESLVTAGRKDIVPSVILNDTTAVFLSACYEEGTPDVIGSICGTGHNSAYYEPKKKMVINLEAGNFSPASQTRFDKLLDSESNCPGEQLLEKMVAGNYLARLVGLVAKEYGLNGAHIQTAADLSVVLQKQSNLLYPVVRAVIKRAAGLVAAEYFGIYNYLKRNEIILKNIAVDGSIYNKIPFFRQEVANALVNFMPEPPRLLAREGSSLKGAAVACAFVKQRCF